MCANIAHYSSSLPVFNYLAEEKGNAQIQSASFSDLIFGGGSFFGRNTKRCVYRGAGAVCSRDLTAYKTDEKKKLFACAPNFYCEELGAGSFNTELVREPSGIRHFLYGQEGNVLGRPLHYVNARGFLTDEIIENLEHNASTDVYQIGICLPGKDVSGPSASWVQQQKIKDYATRTDYINQVSSCDSLSYEDTGRSRVHTCPTFVLDEDHDDFGNYTHFQKPDPFSAPHPFGIQSYRAQNMCGNEAATGGANPFLAIEADPLSVISSILTPTLARDACFKRAGSPCFTDLDCSPNRLHGEEMLHLDRTSFGGSLAEYEYWSQTLVCSQDTLNDEFEFRNNRCCREIGQDFTMYTRIENTTDDFMDYLGLETGPIEQNPRVERLPGHGLSGGPGYGSATSGAYSRYALVDMLTSTQSSYVGTGTKARSPLIHLNDNLNTAGYQWKALSETGEGTCCGGNWVRKFADGTHNWANFKKLNINFENFQCLNYTLPLWESKPGQASKINWQKEMDKFCLSPSGHGCVQWGVYQLPDLKIQAPKMLASSTFSEWKSIMEGDHTTYGTLFTGSGSTYTSCAGGGICGYVDTTTEKGTCTGNVFSDQRLNPLAPYQPLVLNAQETADSKPHRASCVQVGLGPSDEPVLLSVSLPVYIGDPSNIQGIQFKFLMPTEKTSIRDQTSVANPSTIVEH